jgi:hypothetical protein
MYICKNCGNSEKFIGFVQEQGKAFIYQNTCEPELTKPSDAENRSNNNEVYTEVISENLSWAYFLSGKEWKSTFKLKQCYYCNSSDIAWQ